MKITVTVTREYEMDAAKALAEPTFAPPAADAPTAEKEAWVRETFYELCGFERDADHVDGTFVKLVEESAETEFVFPKPEPRCSRCSRLLHGYRGPLCRYCDGTAE